MESVCVNRRGASPSPSLSDSRKAKSVHLSVFDTVLCCAVVLQAWPNWPFRIGNNSRQEGKKVATTATSFGPERKMLWLYYE